MATSFRRMAPLWLSYLLLFALSAMGPLLSQYGGLSRGHWAFLFLMPFAIGCIPYSFIMGEIIQYRTRQSARSSWRWGLFHAIVIYAIFIVGIFDMLIGTVDFLYYAAWMAPAFVSGIFLVIGMAVMRVEQARSDARYGVEVSRGDPWASFFDLEWEEDTPRKVTAQTGHEGQAPKRKRRIFTRNKSKTDAAEGEGAAEE